MIERSAGFQWVSARLGRRLVMFCFASRVWLCHDDVIMLLPHTSGGMLHNVTAFDRHPVIIRLYDSTGFIAWLLCGSLSLPI